MLCGDSLMGLQVSSIGCFTGVARLFVLAGMEIVVVPQILKRAA